MIREMTTQTLTPDARRNVVLMLHGAFDGMRGKQHYEMVDAQGGPVNALKLVDIPVFRSGTFRDSMGIQHTWEPLHIEQMVTHFDLLRNRGILPLVPVREGHPSFFGDDPVCKVLGWHDSLRTEDRVNPIDNQTYTYLLASYTILDPEGADKVNRGLFVNRSAEVGSYVTNSEAEFWPVYLGVAYVDLPAVEGLESYAKDKGLGTRFSIMNDQTKEAPVGDKNEQQGAPASQTTPPAAPAAPAPAAPVATPPAAPEPVPAATATHSAPTSGTFTFSVNGQPTTNFAHVQAHITSLETFAKETKETARESFVEGLASSNKIMASKMDDLKVFAKGLSDEQFKQWQASWDAAPALPVLQTHGHGGEGTTVTGNTGGPSKLDDEIAVAEGIINHHRSTGMPQAKLEQLASFKHYQKLLAQKQSGAPSA